MNKRILVVVDVQQDFMPTGTLPVADGDAVVPVINNLMEKVKFDYIIATQDWHPADHISFADNNGKNVFETIETEYGVQVMWPRHCVQNTQGADFHADLKTENFDLIIRKGANQKIDSYSALLENDGKTQTALMPFVRGGDDEYYVTGLATDYCVFNTAKDLRNEGKTVFLVKDAVRGVAPDTTDKALEDLRKIGVYFIESSNLI